MYLAKQYGFTVGSHVAVIANEEKRTIRVILDTPKTIPKTGKAICLAALERVKELEATLKVKESTIKNRDISIDSLLWEKAYLKTRLKGGKLDPLNPDYWTTPILNKIKDQSFYNNTNKLEHSFKNMFGKDWIKSAFFVVWTRENIQHKQTRSHTTSIQYYQGTIRHRERFENINGSNKKHTTLQTTNRTTTQSKKPGGTTRDNSNTETRIRTDTD